MLAAGTTIHSSHASHTHEATRPKVNSTDVLQQSLYCAGLLSTLLLLVMCMIDKHTVS